jgi:hypothetical protein
MAILCPADLTCTANVLPYLWSADIRSERGDRVHRYLSESLQLRHRTSGRCARVSWDLVLSIQVQGLRKMMLLQNYRSPNELSCSAIGLDGR